MLLYDPLLLFSYLIYYIIYIVGYAGIIVCCVISYDMDVILYVAAGVNVYFIYWFCNNGPAGVAGVGVVGIIGVNIVMLELLELLVLCFGSGVMFWMHF